MIREDKSKTTDKQNAQQTKGFEKKGTPKETGLGNKQANKNHDSFGRK